MAAMRAGAGGKTAVSENGFVHVKLAERPKFIVARAIMDRNSNAYDPTALSFRENDKIQIHEQNENGLWIGEIVSESSEVWVIPSPPWNGSSLNSTHPRFTSAESEGGPFSLPPGGAP